MLKPRSTRACATAIPSERRSASGEGEGWVTRQGLTGQLRHAVANMRLMLSMPSHLDVAYKGELRMVGTTRKGAAIATIAAVAALGFVACGQAGSDGAAVGGGANEWNGEFSVANGDSQFYVGDGPHRPDTVTVKCSDKGGVITATLTESQTGNTFTTAQPDGGEGYAGGTLTLGDGGEEFTWKPLDGVTDEDIRGDAQVFEDEMQDGSPVLWTGNDSFTFGTGLTQRATKSGDGQVRVQTPGQVDCSGGSDD